MSEDLDWVIVTGSAWNKEIGAVGFSGNKIAAVVAFYDDADGNYDGEVSAGEWIASKLSPISLEGTAITTVLMAARLDLNIVSRDSSIQDMAAKAYVSLGFRMIADGVYAAYFKRGVSMSAGGIAKNVTQSKVKQLMVKKGFEKLFKEGYDAAVK